MGARMRYRWHYRQERHIHAGPVCFPFSIAVDLILLRVLRLVPPASRCKLYHLCICEWLSVFWPWGLSCSMQSFADGGGRKKFPSWAASLLRIISIPLLLQGAS